MKRTATNGAPAALRRRPEWMRNSSISTVIDLIRRNDGISRAELARDTRLSAQAMSKVVGRLIDAGVVRETGRISIGVGTPRTRLSIVPKSRYALGVHLDRSGFSMVLANFAGRIVDQRQERFKGPVPPSDVVAMLGEASDNLLRGLGSSRTRVAGCGLGVAALSTPVLWSWKDVPLASLVQDQTGIPITLDKSTNLATIAESWRSYRPGWTVAVYVGTGIGAGLMLDGAVYRGVHSDAGELGHMVLDPFGPRCVCGRRGCVEALSNPAAVVDRYRQSVQSATQNRTEGTPYWDADTQEQLERITNEANRGIATARSALVESGRLLGLASGNLVTLLDVEELIVTGPMLAPLGPHYQHGVRNGILETRAGLQHPLKITISEIDAAGIALGGALLVLQSLTFD